MTLDDLERCCRISGEVTEAAMRRRELVSEALRTLHVSYDTNKLPDLRRRIYQAAIEDGVGADNEKR
jgi:hypothetical protein